MSDTTPDNEALRRGLVDPATLVTAGLVTELIVDIRRIAGVMETFAATLVDTRAEQRAGVDEVRHARRLNAILGAALLFVVLAASLGTWVGLARLTSIAETNRANNRQLVECTTPSPPPGQAIDAGDRVHECYDSNLATQARSVSLVGQDTLDAAICARQEATTDGIITCFRYRVARRTPTTTTTRP